MKIYHDIEQGSPEWHDIRAKNFTASELGEWILEPLSIVLTVAEIERMLDQFGISRKGVRKRDELIALLPNPEFYVELVPGAKDAILRKIKQERYAKLMALDYDDLSEPEQIWLDRERELAEKSEMMFERNIPVKYGKILEPHARDLYWGITGMEVSQVGFVEHDSGGFGCSPDGLVSLNSLGNHFTDAWHHGLEIKCPIPETHLSWLIDGGLPDVHKLQVHASMAVTGLDRWDFMSYCPGEKELIVTVYRDDFTERVLAGLQTMVEEKAKMKEKLARIWRGDK